MTTAEACKVETDCVEGSDRWGAAGTQVTFEMGDEFFVAMGQKNR